MKIIFMGTPDFAKESLEKLYDSGYEIALVVAPPDRPKGRGMKMIACPVKEFAIEKNIPVFQPNKIIEMKQELEDMNPDLIVVVSYGKILPRSILEIPKIDCINVHPSLLPKYRGSAPIQWAVLNGDKYTGVTIMRMSEQMDAGDIILQKQVEIEDNETTGELWDRLSTISSKLLVQAIEAIEDGVAEYTVQPKEYTLAPMIEKSMAKVDWKEQEKINFSKTKEEIKNLVRGLNPFLGAYCNLGQKKLKLWKIKIVDENADLNIEPGTIIMSDQKKGLYIKTKDGVISVIEIQGENARKMNILDFLRGNKIEVGQKLS